MARFKAAVLKSFSKPFEIEEVDLEPPQMGWKGVSVRAVGVCGRDVVVWRGGFANLKPPLILGHEVYGEYNGKPVGLYPAVSIKDGKASSWTGHAILGENIPGGYAEKVFIPEDNLVPLPDTDYPKYAASVCGVATFIHVARLAGMGAGDKALVTGASGGVGIHGIQYLKLLGVEVYAYTRSPAKAKVLRSLGVKVVTSFDFYRSVGRVDFVIENVGAQTINESMRSLKQGGTLILVGNVKGERIVLERPALVIMREISIVGSAAYTRSEYETAVRMVGEGAIRPFYKRFPLESINEAYKEVLDGRIVGRAVIVV